ncbi:Uncharacterised protein [Candidatus Gugararchaeum adminiculabundum]|nr:Uncharacterised protein [Candidatus Gugararchaeum adminiculabundum]
MMKGRIVYARNAMLTDYGTKRVTELYAKYDAATIVHIPGIAIHGTTTGFLKKNENRMKDYLKQPKKHRTLFSDMEATQKAMPSGHAFFLSGKFLEEMPPEEFFERLAISAISVAKFAVGYAQKNTGSWIGTEKDRPAVIILIKTGELEFRKVMQSEIVSCFKSGYKEFDSIRGKVEQFVLDEKKHANADDSCALVIDKFAIAIVERIFEIAKENAQGKMRMREPLTDK